MYLGRTTDNKEEMHRKPPFGPGFTELGTAVTMQIWHSSFTDPGPDFNEFVLLDVHGQRVGVKRVEGY